jgi:hypothetical protein
VKIIMVDNFNREGPGHDDVIVAEVTDKFWGEHIVRLLNGWSQRDPHTAEFFKLANDDYKLHRFEP